MRRLTWFRVDTARRSHIKAHEQAHVSPVTFPPGFHPIVPRHRGTFGVVSQFACPPCGDGPQYSSAFLVFWSLGFRPLTPEGRHALVAWLDLRSMAVRAAGAGATMETPVRIKLETLGVVYSPDSVLQFDSLEPAEKASAYRNLSDEARYSSFLGNLVNYLQNTDALSYNPDVVTSLINTFLMGLLGYLIRRNLSSMHRNPSTKNVTGKVPS